MVRILQLSIWFVGIFFLIWAFFDPLFLDTEGSLTGRFCLPLAASVTLIILGWAIPGRMIRPAFWFALALMGQAVALQMTEAGPRAEYQHYTRSLGRLLMDTSPLFLIYLAVQTTLVLVGLRSHWSDIRGWVSRTFKIWQLLGISLVFFLFSATLSRDISLYISELIFATLVQAVNLGNIVLTVWSLPEDTIDLVKSKFEKLLGRAQEGNMKGPDGVDRFAGFAAVWVMVLAAFLCFFSYERIPHIPDEAAYLYHARYFAEGILTVPAPLVHNAFDIELVDYKDGKWYSAQLPGWPAMLALGVLAGVPWIVNPVLAGLNVLLTYILMWEIYDRYTARIVVLLLCVSPWYIFMGMNFMSHTFTLTCVLIAAVAVARARGSGKAIWGWIAGFSVGMVSLVRPLDGFAVAGLLGLWGIGIGGKRLKTSSIAGLVIGAIIMGSVLLLYNYLLTDSSTKFPFMAYTDKYYGPRSNALGFGPERGFGWPTLDPIPGHGLIDVGINAFFNIFSINIELFGWSTGSLILIAVMLFSGVMKRSDYIMLAVIGIVIGIHSFYWFSGGPDFGARYWYLIIVPCVALTVRGIQYLAVRPEFGSSVVATQGTRIMVGVLFLCLLTLVNYFPWRAIDKYYHYRGIRPDIQRLAKEYGFGRSLILIRGRRHIAYASAAIYNPLQFNDDSPIYAWDETPEIRTQLLKSYPDRNVWIVNGPSITHRGFELVSGPFSTTELLSLKETL